MGMDNGMPWSDVFRVACWFLWKWRNRSYLKMVSVLPQPIHADLQFAKDVALADEPLNRKKIRVRSVNVRWRFPPIGWVNLNTDGATKGNPRDGGC